MSESAVQVSVNVTLIATALTSVNAPQSQTKVESTFLLGIPSEPTPPARFVLPLKGASPGHWPVYPGSCSNPGRRSQPQRQHESITFAFTSQSQSPHSCCGRAHGERRIFATVIHFIAASQRPTIAMGGIFALPLLEPPLRVW